MCGCMLIHATMNHEGYRHPASQRSMPVPAATCAHCGFPLQEGFVFCPGCGMSLRTEKCPACGQKVDLSWATCAYCGSPLGETQKHAAHH